MLASTTGLTSQRLSTMLPSIGSTYLSKQRFIYHLSKTCKCVNDSVKINMFDFAKKILTSRLRNNSKVGEFAEKLKNMPTPIKK
jgi:hypothetical protein